MDAEFPLRSSSQERIATTRSKHSRWLMPSHTYKESVGAHAAGDVVAVSGAIGPATRSVFGRSSTAAGLYGAEEAARRSSESRKEVDQSGIC